jgi:integration host factor subunit beta
VTKKLETFNKSDLIEQLSIEFPQLSKEKISNAIDIIINMIIETIALDDKVEIRGFGTFSKKYIRPRKFINPKTKAVSFIGETATLHFKPSKSLIQN